VFVKTNTLKKKTKKTAATKPKITVVSNEETFGFDTDNFDLFDSVKTENTKPVKKTKQTKFNNKVLDWVKYTQQGYNLTFDFRVNQESNLTALNAAHKTVSKIIQNYPPPYTLFLSGGVDSQAMLYAWHTSGKPYQTCSVKYNFNSNEHDLLSLEAFSKLHNIHINYVDFDLIDFLENKHDDYANKYLCGSPQITAYMRMVELFNNGTAIMSGNFIMPGGATHIGPNQFGLYHFAKMTNIPFIPYFFIETQELAYSFKMNTYTKAMINKEVNKTPDLGYVGKVALYQSHGFPVLSQPVKLNGFEKIKEYYDKNSPRLPTIKDRLSKGESTSYRNFDLLYRNKYEGKLSVYKYHTLTNREN
jgi:hypothetical protein